MSPGRFGATALGAGVGEGAAPGELCGVVLGTLEAVEFVPAPAAPPPVAEPAAEPLAPPPAPPPPAPPPPEDCAYRDDDAAAANSKDVKIAFARIASFPLGFRVETYRDFFCSGLRGDLEVVNRRRQAFRRRFRRTLAANRN